MTKNKATYPVEDYNHIEVNTGLQTDFKPR